MGLSHVHLSQLAQFGQVCPVPYSPEAGLTRQFGRSHCCRRHDRQYRHSFIAPGVTFVWGIASSGHSVDLGFERFLREPAPYQVQRFQQREE